MVNRNFFFLLYLSIMHIAYWIRKFQQSTIENFVINFPPVGFFFRSHTSAVFPLIYSDVFRDVIKNILTS